MQTPGTLQTGAVLAGRYRVESLLGQGGMAWVFRAVDTHLDRPVAIKVLRESAAAHTERLRREARAAARLAHPAVVGIHDLGQLTDGRPFIVLEFIEGEPLSRLLAEGAVPAARAVHLLSPVAGALGEAHQHGIIHRDLKPDNLLLQRSPGAADRLRLLDFGIAAIEPVGEDQSRFTSDGSVFGTPEYMAPEQAMGQRATPATDVWALGVLLHTLLAGTPPFTGKHVPEILYKLTQTAPTPLPMDAPRHLAALVADCLQKDPALRPADGAAVLARLEAWAAPATAAPATPRPLPVVAPPPPRRPPWHVPVAVGGVCLVVGMAAGSLVRRSDAPPAPAPVAEVAPVTAAPAPPTEAEPVQDTGSLADVDALLDQSPAAALSWLTAHPDAGVPAQRLLRRGLARLATEQVSAGLADLAAALVDDATLALDVRVLPAVVEALDQRDGEEAVGLLAGPLAAGAGPTLLTVAAEGGLRARWRAVEALEKAGAAEAKPARFASLRKDLRVGDCERRRKAAEALGAWGDGAAVPDLKRARGRGFLDNLCMSGEIDAALKALKDAPVSAP